MLSLSGTSEDSLIMHGTVCQSKLIVVAKSKFIILICIPLTGLLKTFTCSIYSVCCSKNIFILGCVGGDSFVCTTETA